MGASIETFVILAVLAIVVILVITLVTTHNFNKKLNTITFTKGASGVAGQTINMSCPADMNIDYGGSNATNRAVLICSNLINTNAAGHGAENMFCDPYYQENGQLTNFFNPSTTSDITASMIQTCAGKNTCSYVIPANYGGTLNSQTCTTNCAATGGQLQLISTYDCVPV